MNEGTLVKSHLDEFNSIIMRLKNVNIKIYSEDQDMIVLFFNYYLMILFLIHH